MQKLEIDGHKNFKTAYVNNHHCLWVYNDFEWFVPSLHSSSIFGLEINQFLEMEYKQWSRWFRFWSIERLEKCMNECRFIGYTFLRFYFLMRLLLCMVSTVKKRTFNKLTVRPQFPWNWFQISGKLIEKQATSTENQTHSHQLNDGTCIQHERITHSVWIHGRLWFTVGSR